MSGKTLVFAAVLCLIAGLAPAAENTVPREGTDAISVPQLINYQGKLTDAAGNPLTGNYNMKFEIFDDELAGATYWNETQNNVPVASGLFNVIMGSQTAISNLPDGPECWLEITVAGEKITPRVRLAAVPYTYKAAKAEDANKLGGVAASGFLQTGTSFSGDVAGPYNNLQLGTGVVGSTEIADGAVASADILDNTIAAADLATTGVTAATYGSATQVAQVAVNNKGQVTGAANVTITGVPPSGAAGGDLTGSTYPNPTIAANAVIEAKIAASAVTSAKILDATIATADIADGQVNSAKITDNSVATGDILDGTIANADISASAAIASSKLATVQVANGGTGVTTLTGVVIGSGTSAFTAQNPLTVSYGGTGATTHTLGNVLIGAGTGAITSLSRSGIDSRATFPPEAHTQAVTAGGTGLTASVQGGILYGTSTSAVAWLAAGTSGYLLQSGATGAPSWLATVPIARGGTNNTAYTNWGALYYNGTNLQMASTAAGASGQPLLSAGSAAPSWGTLTTSYGGTGYAGTPANGTIPYGQGTTALAFLAAGTSGRVLRSAGAAAPTWDNPLALGNAANSPSTLGSSGFFKWGSAAITNTSCGTYSSTALTFTLTGAATTDYVFVSGASGIGTNLIFGSAYVSAANVVTFRVANPSGTAANSGTTVHYLWIKP